VGRDVTARRASERTLEKAKSFLDAVVNAIPTPVLVKDEEHRYIAANTAFTDFFRSDLASILGKGDYDFFSCEDAAFYQATDREALATGRVIEYEHAYTLDGITQWMMVRKSRLIRPDESPVVVLMLSDVTQRRAAEQALRQSEARFRSLTELSADWYWEQDEQFSFTLQFAFGRKNCTEICSGGERYAEERGEAFDRPACFKTCIANRPASVPMAL
jgi:PAS domain S-box-containing protein